MIAGKSKKNIFFLYQLTCDKEYNDVSGGMMIIIIIINDRIMLNE